MIGAVTELCRVTEGADTSVQDMGIHHCFGFPLGKLLVSILNEGVGVSVGFQNVLLIKVVTALV